MPTPIELVFKASGVDSVVVDIDPLVTVLKDIGKGVDDVGKKTKAVNAGASSAWNPYVAALKSAEAEQKKLREEAERLPNALRNAGSAARQAFSTFRRGAGDAQQSIDKLNASLRTLDNALRSNQYDSINQALASGRNVGIGLTASATAGGYLIGRGVSAASEMKNLRRSLTFSLGSQAAADVRIASLQQLDRSSPFDFKSSVRGYSNLVGKGFGNQEAFDLLVRTGDILGRTGGTDDNLNESLRQLGQIRAKNKVEKQDLDALAEGGGIPIYQILQNGLTPERFKSAMSGDQALTGAEFFAAFSTGSDKFQGGMAEANKELPGQISNLNSALYQLGASLNQSVLPAVTSLVQAGTGVVDFFNALPQPLKDIAGWGAAVGVAVTALAGLGITMITTAGQAVIALQALRTAMSTTAATAATSAATTATAGAAATAGGAATGTAAGAAAGAGAAGLGATALGVGAYLGAGVAGVGVGTAVGYGLYKAGQSVGLIDREQSFLDRMETGWGRTRDIFTGNWGHYDRTWQKKWADDAKAKEALKIANNPVVAATASTGATPSPVMLASSVLPVLPSSQNISGGVGAARSQLKAVRREDDPFADAIYSKRLELRDAPKEEKGRIRQELDSLINQQRNWKNSHRGRVQSASDALEAAREAEKQRKEEQRLAAQRARSDASVASAQTGIDDEVRIGELEAQLADARADKNKAEARRLQGEIARAKAEKKFQEDMARAQGLSGIQREAAIRAAQARRAGAIGYANARYGSGAQTAAAGQGLTLGAAGFYQNNAAMLAYGGVVDNGASSGGMFRPGTISPMLGGGFSSMMGLRASMGELAVETGGSIIRVKNQVSQDANGNWRIEWEPVVIPNNGPHTRRNRF